ncbi:hypothetical protein Ciccas_008749 [Cichlidogyrus casuarinus]|uniref:Uncharacterized protein n=1 Tax=Cichlidogyrus casuarinus TaxID=1844966 RepID=A0ABD2PZY4_9PLAT
MPDAAKYSYVQPILIGLLTIMVILTLILIIVMLRKRKKQKKPNHGRAREESLSYNKALPSSLPPQPLFYDTRSEIYMTRTPQIMPQLQKSQHFSHDAGLLNDPSCLCTTSPVISPTFFTNNTSIYNGGSRKYDNYANPQYQSHVHNRTDVVESIYNHDSAHGSGIYPLPNRSSSGLGTSLTSPSNEWLPQVSATQSHQLMNYGQRGDSVEGNSNNEAVSESSHSITNYPPISLLHCSSYQSQHKRFEEKTKSIDSIPIVDPPERFKSIAEVNGIEVEPMSFDETFRSPDGDEDPCNEDGNQIKIPPLAPLRINYEPSRFGEKRFPSSMAC